MKPSSPGASSLRRRLTATERERLLTELDRSGFSAATFARERQLTYTTLCHWRRQRARGKPVAFAEVEIVPPPVVEAGWILHQMSWLYQWEAQLREERAGPVLTPRNWRKARQKPAGQAAQDAAARQKP